MRPMNSVTIPCTMKPAINAAQRSIGPMLTLIARTLVTIADTVSMSFVRSSGTATVEVENTMAARTAPVRVPEKEKTQSRVREEQDVYKFLRRRRSRRSEEEHQQKEGE